MNEFHGLAATSAQLAPSAAFELITDLARLPEWNQAIESVIDRPAALEEGSEWTVKMHPPHMPSWKSISRLKRLDWSALSFAYETRNADGNPSFTTWAWHVTGSDGGSELTVTWDCYLKTWDRRVLAGPVRRRQLEREVAASLGLLARADVAGHLPRLRG